MRTLIGMIIGIVIGYVYKDSIKEHIVDPFRQGLEGGGKSTDSKEADRP